MACGPRKAGVARRGVGLGLGGVLLAHGRRKKALTGGSRALARRGGGGTGLGQEREKRAGLSWTARMRKGKRKGRLGRGEGDGLGRPLGWAVGGKEKEMGLGRLG